LSAATGFWFKDIKKPLQISTAKAYIGIKTVNKPINDLLK